MRFKQKFFLWVFHLLGWEFTGTENALRTWNETQKCILIVAPHTAIADYPLGYLALLALGKRAKFLINKKFFFFPLGFLLKANGGIPVNTGKDKDFLKKVAEAFEKTDRMFLTITPEGTRKRVMRWRKGFYQLAETTGMPLLLGALDYKKKNIILGNEFKITGDFNADMRTINEFYKDVSGKYPELFALHHTNIHKG